MIPPARMLVGGELVESADAFAFPVVSPATGEQLGSVPDAGAADLEAALAAAAAAPEEWAQDASLRARCVERLQAALMARWDDLRALVATEVGTPAALVPEPSFVAPDRARVGVLAVVTPLTSPVLALEAVGAGLLAGDVVVHKPAAGAGWFACEVGRVAVEEADLPSGVLQVLPSRDVDVAIALTTDPRVDGVWFAGSAVAAERVEHQADDRLVRLDVGRPSTVVVRHREDVDAVVREVARRVAMGAGQACGVPARLLVPRTSYDGAVAAAIEAMAAVTTDLVGPVASQVHRDRVLRYLALAEQEGGACHSSGPVPKEGWWVAPTVVTGLAPAARVVQEEVLGPVLMVLPHDGDGLEVAATIPSYEVEVR